MPPHGTGMFYFRDTHKGGLHTKTDQRATKHAQNCSQNLRRRKNLPKKTKAVGRSFPMQKQVITDSK